MFDGNSWKIVAGGQLAQENLRFMGTFNAATNQIVALTDEGVSEQKQDGSLHLQSAIHSQLAMTL